MTDGEVMYEDFVASRRSGRRNAVLTLDGIAAPGGGSGATLLSHDLARLSVNQSGDKGDDPEKTQDSPAEEQGGEEEEHF